MRICCLFVVMLPCAVQAAPDGFSAAAYVENFRADFERDDGVEFELIRRRFGLEYWETVQPDFSAGLQAGYSETESGIGRPFTSTWGMFAGIGLRYEPWLSTHWRWRLRADVQYQRETRDGYDTSSFEFISRWFDSSIESALQLEYGAIQLAPGVVWRDADYRETIRRSSGDARRTADLQRHGGVFMEFGINAASGGRILLRLEHGAYAGGRLAFEQRF